MKNVAKRAVQAISEKWNNNVIPLALAVWVGILWMCLFEPVEIFTLKAIIVSVSICFAGAILYLFSDYQHDMHLFKRFLADHKNVAPVKARVIYDHKSAIFDSWYGMFKKGIIEFQTGEVFNCQSPFSFKAIYNHCGEINHNFDYCQQA